MENSNLPMMIKKESFFSKLKKAFIKIFTKKVEAMPDVAIAAENGAVPISSNSVEINRNVNYFFNEPNEENINNVNNIVNKEDLLAEALRQKEEIFKNDQMTIEEKRETFLSKTIENPEMFDVLSTDELKKIENHYDLEINKAEKEIATLTIVEKIEKDTNLLNMLNMAQLELVEGYYDREIQRAELQLANLTNVKI